MHAALDNELLHHRATQVDADMNALVLGDVVSVALNPYVLPSFLVFQLPLPGTG